MKSVIYTGAFRFPDRDAAALRVFSVGQLFRTAGYSVEFAGWEQAHEKGGYYEYRGHKCYSQSEFRDRERSVFGRLLGFLLRGASTARWLIRNRRFGVVVAYNPPALFSIYLIVSCRLRRQILVLDNTEWYEAAHLPGGRFGPAALENWARMRLIYPLFKNVICISTFLQRHFEGRNVVNIPPIIADDYGLGSAAKESPSSAIFVLYAGEAGKKDLLVDFIKALPALNQALGRETVLRIAGMNWNTVNRLMEGARLSPSAYRIFIECYGRVSRQEVRQLYRDSHFSILFRENKRYALAGFPTKAVESWAHGCPIIANRVGDFGALAVDGEDAVIVDSNRLDIDLPIALKRILSSGAYSQMAKNCVDKAQRLFSVASQQDRFIEFAKRLAI